MTLAARISRPFKSKAKPNSQISNPSHPFQPLPSTPTRNIGSPRARTKTPTTKPRSKLTKLKPFATFARLAPKSPSYRLTAHHRRLSGAQAPAKARTWPRRLRTATAITPAAGFGLSSTDGSSSSRTRRANKAALALRQLILDPSPLPHTDLPPPSSGWNTTKSSTKKTTVPRLRVKDVERLRTQLLQPEAAGRVIASARTLGRATGKCQDPKHPDLLWRTITYHDSQGALLGAGPRGMEPTRAVCLDCNEQLADTLMRDAAKCEKSRKGLERQFEDDRYATIKARPLPPPRLPILLSLLEPLDGHVIVDRNESTLPNLSLNLEGHREATQSIETGGPAQPGGEAPVLDSTFHPFGLMLPPSAMSIHRPLAGALPTPETLKRGFDALLNAESKIYLYDGPNHQGLHPPTDRLSIFTYWWGFELALPPPTMEYLAKVKIISLSLLNLLGIIVFAVPGGTRELAPFVGVLSRFIETEWLTLKAQDEGRGIVCGATWFIPAAIVARPWDFEDPGVETPRSTAKPALRLIDVRM